MNKKILLVDDEPQILNSFKRELRREFDVHLAPGGPEALEVIEAGEPFAAVVSDFQMPVMNGVEFLKKARIKTPDTVRLMLTGQADLQVAMDAVNEGNLFRFLTKPCSKETLQRALNSACDLHRLITGEKELLEKTLGGSIRVMSEMLGLINPAVFGRSMRIKNCVDYLASELALPNRWQFEVAALLSQIGYVTVPAEIISKVNTGKELDEVEQEIIDRHPQVAETLLEHIPRLENVARMIAAQNCSFQRRTEKDNFLGEDLICLGGNLLRIAGFYDSQIRSGVDGNLVRQRMLDQPEEYFPQAVTLLADFEQEDVDDPHREVALEQLNVNMVLDDDIVTMDGLTVAVKGQDVTSMMLQRLQAFAQSVGVNEPIKVVDHSPA